MPQALVRQGRAAVLAPTESVEVSIPVSSHPHRSTLPTMSGIRRQTAIRSGCTVTPGGVQCALGSSFGVAVTQPR